MELFFKFHKDPSSDSYKVEAFSLEGASAQRIVEIEDIMNSNSFKKEMSALVEFVDHIFPLYTEFGQKHIKSVTDTVNSIKKSIQTATITIEAKIFRFQTSMTSLINPSPSTAAIIQKTKSMNQSKENFVEEFHLCLKQWMEEQAANTQKFIEVFENELFSDLKGLFRFHMGNQNQFFLKFLETVMSQKIPLDLIFSGAITAWSRQFNTFLQKRMEHELGNPNKYFEKILALPTSASLSISGAFSRMLISQLTQINENFKFSSYLTNSDFNGLKWFENWSTQISLVFKQFTVVILQELEKLPEAYKTKLNDDFQIFDSIIRETFLSTYVLKNHDFMKTKFEKSLKQLSEEKKKFKKCTKKPFSILVGYKDFSKYLKNFGGDSELINACETNLSTISGIIDRFDFDETFLQSIIIGFSPKDHPSTILVENSMDTYDKLIKDIASSWKNKAKIQFLFQDEAWIQEFRKCGM